MVSCSCLNVEVANSEPCSLVSSPNCGVPRMLRSAGFSPMMVVFLGELRAATAMWAERSRRVLVFLSSRRKVLRIDFCLW